MKAGSSPTSAKLLFGLAVLLPAADILMNIAAARHPAPVSGSDGSASFGMPVEPDATQVDLGAPGEPQQLLSGWWKREPLPEGVGGRFTQAEATLRLERRAEEGGLGLAVSFLHPDGLTRGYVDVNGQRVQAFQSGNGRRILVLDIRKLRDRILTVRLVVENPFMHGPRLVGMMVHAVWLQESPVAVSGDPGSIEGEPPERASGRREAKGSETGVGPVEGAQAASKGAAAGLASGLELGAVENARPELGAGWWNAEAWAGGGAGRWTREEALLRLERRGSEPDLLLDVSFSHPSNLTTGFVEVNGQRLLHIRHANGRRRLVVSIGSIPERVLVVRFVAEKPFVGREHGMAAGDARSLGFFVHELRLLGAAE